MLHFVESQVVCLSNDAAFYYLVVTDTDLHNVIKRGNILKDVHKRYITYQILKATKYLHSGNVIHRDQKVRCIFLVHVFPDQTYWPYQLIGSSKYCVLCMNEEVSEVTLNTAMTSQWSISFFPSLPTSCWMVSVLSNSVILAWPAHWLRLLLMKKVTLI